ncbi:MAG TPA: diacylglycerol kinase family protein [Thermoanaerobaculia bacterium]|nr:diacylglycerol kinase family protein [Thermoanaerobaculia bacterium]
MPARSPRGRRKAWWRRELTLEQLVFLVNPAAGSGRAPGVWQSLVDSHPELRAAKVVRERDPLASADALRRAIADGARGVVALGGDGTAHMLSNLLLSDGLADRVAMGLVPAGTGSDLCKSLGIPDAPGPALQKALEGEPRPLDAFAVRRPGVDEPGGRPWTWCVNTVSTGVAGVVVDEVQKLPRKGAAVYMTTTIRTLLRYRPVRCRIAVDGEPFYEGPIFLLAVANGPTFGKGMRVAPHAKVDDGLFDVVIVGDVPRWMMPLRLPQLQFGRHLGRSGVLFKQARRVRCEPLGPFTPYELDGDMGAPGPVEVEVVPGAVRVLR